MSDPALELQKAELATLKASGGVGTGGRVYDVVPDGPTFPYVQAADHHEVGDDDECSEASELFSRLHVWSRYKGWKEAKDIVGQIRARLRASVPAPSGAAVIDLKVEQVLYLNDPDGVTRHAVVELRYLIQHG